MTPAVRAGYLAPYDSWRNREAVYRFVMDIPLRPSHPSYATLAAHRGELAAVSRSADPIDLGHERLVSLATSFSTGSSSSFPRPRSTVWPTPAITSWKTPTEQVIPLVEEFLERHPWLEIVGGETHSHEGAKWRRNAAAREEFARPRHRGRFTDGLNDDTSFQSANAPRWRASWRSRPRSRETCTAGRTSRT